MTTIEPTLDQLLQRHENGEAIEVPATLAAEFAQAQVADAALRGFLDGPETTGVLPREPRSPPRLPHDYTITCEIGAGGMGVVYLARQKSLNRDVAIKVLRPSHQQFRTMVERFLHEAQHLARLRHPHIVAIYEIGDADGEPYFTMDYVDGEPLTQRLRPGPLSPTQAIELFQQIASAVQHAHKHGVVHRDLKPANILLNQRGEAFVTDFGLARQMQEDSTLTQTGEVLGTPQYMAPEQARGEGALIGEATDIHALGLILYEMLAGRPAFEAKSPADVLVKLLHHDPEPISRRDRRIPRDLETICLKCLQKNPAARYANVATLLEDIRRYEAGAPLTARRPGWLSLGVRWCRRHWKLAVTAVVAATLALVLASRVFDRSYSELVAWGDEELATGNSRVAAQVYARAWKKGDEAQQRQLVERIAQICRLSKSPSEVLPLALDVVALEPSVSFGQLDVLVAQALVARERAADPSGSIDIWHARPRPSLERIQQRLDLALEQAMPAQTRLEVEETLAAVKLVLNQGQPQARQAPEYLARLPRGTNQELQQLLADDSQPSWKRAKAGIALGKQLESLGDGAAALAAYEQARVMIERVFPFYRGVAPQLGPDRIAAKAAASEECQLVASLCADLARLAPHQHRLPTGEVELTLSGVPLPDDVVLGVRLELSSSTSDGRQEDASQTPTKLVRLDDQRKAIVGVLDGNYGVRLGGHQGRWQSGSDRFMRLLEIETDDWPAELTIRGGRVQLPPARMRLADEILLATPASGVMVTLDDAEFRWRPVANAAYYQVTLSYSTESPHPTTTSFAFVRTTEPLLRLRKLESADRQAVQQNLRQGRTGGWSVAAYDERGRRTGVSLEERRFLVAEELHAE